MDVNELKPGCWVLVDSNEGRSPAKPFMDQLITEIDGDKLIFSNGAMRLAKNCSGWPLQKRCFLILKLKFDDTTIKRCHDRGIFSMHELQIELGRYSVVNNKLDIPYEPFK